MTKFSGKAFCAVVVVALSVGGAAAQGAAPVAQGNSDIVMKPSTEAMAVGRMLSACMVARHPAVAIRYIAAEAEVRDKIAKGMNEALSECLMNDGNKSASARMSLANGDLQGLFAEAFVISRTDASSALPVAAAPNYAATWVSADPSQSVVDRMAICLAATRPAEALALVRSTPASPDERAAFAAVMPHVGGCLVTGATLKTDRSGLRLAVARAVYFRQVALSASVATHRRALG